MACKNKNKKVRMVRKRTNMKNYQPLYRVYTKDGDTFEYYVGYDRNNPSGINIVGWGKNGK